MQEQSSFSEPKRKHGGAQGNPHPNPVFAALGFSDTIEKRFWKNVFIVPYDRGCWLWIGCQNSRGYGRIGRGTRENSTMLATRLSWILHRGPIPEGLDVCHHCDCPACVRIEHLFLGSAADNAADMIRKGRGSTPPLMRGSNHPNSRLTKEQVQEIRASYPAKNTYELAEAFGVAQVTAWRIIRHLSYRFS